jgi:hypothetical protein
MKRRTLFGFAASLALALPLLAAGERLPEVQVFKTPYCGCCSQWVTRMEEAGFRLKVNVVQDTGPTRRQHGIADALASCHTAVVAGYALEGHVPPAEVKRLLAMKPQAAGLAVPGMPQSAPGMEVPGARDPYDVLLVDRQGRTRVFASYPKA